MKVLKFDNTENSLYPYVLEFNFPDIENLDNILNDLVSQIPDYVRIRGKSDYLEVRIDRSDAEREIRKVELIGHGDRWKAFSV